MNLHISYNGLAWTCIDTDTYDGAPDAGKPANIEDAANARLIAGAPYLLDTARSAAAVLEGFTNQLDQWQVAVLKDLKRAIKEAS